jgi:hypothetical protein
MEYPGSQPAGPRDVEMRSMATRRTARSEIRETSGRPTDELSVSRFPTGSCPNLRCVFVLGTARSGTTWLGNLLASHPEVGAIAAGRHNGLHESHLLDHTRFALPGTWTARDFFERYSNEDYFAIAGLSLESVIEGAPERGDAVDYFRHLMDVWAQRRGKTVWIEKTPKHLIYYADLLRRFPDARFVVIRRSMEETLLSQLAKYPRHDVGRTRQIVEKVYRYVSDIRAMERLAADAPDRVIFTRYETLRDHHDGEVQRLLSFLDLPPARLESRFAASSSFPNAEDRKSFTRAERIVIFVARVAVSLPPFRFLLWLRMRRDRTAAGTFPKYRPDRSAV